ncbi:hypothetical protein Patl1_02331 [Pistacia atlantica]|uniref:Uncharacterized protein n=1 Tax=Pistacia atlantica TaxID=434234 RepID=A0ACC1C7J0_9ROSI|nr:hypothetical protein Patl1_02331 [Pistacia atlantica]
MAARYVLESGLMWCIGDGSKVRIWQDKWLPSASSFKIQSQCLGMDPEAKVATLIDLQSKSWKLDLLKDLFSKSEVNIICRIPISIFNRPDKIVWRCAQKGLFSIKSAYHLQMESQISSQGQSSSAANDNKKWKKLWKLPITNAEKLFLWKACQDILPTKCNLVKKRVIEEPFCTFYCLEEEDVFHALWGCVVAKDIWTGKADLATMRMKKTMLLDVHVAESFATLQAVILAANIGINQIILEGDALQVVNDLLRDEEN